MDYNKLNKHFQEINIDYLYHLGLDSKMNLTEMFGDVKYVVFIRSNGDADYFAQQLTQQIYKLDNLKISCYTIAKDERYHIFKVANTIVISHGIGSPSLLICINEIIKLMWHAKIHDVQFIRIGPGGGIGINPGELVCASEAVNHEFISTWENIEFGNSYYYPSNVDSKLALSILEKNEGLHYGKILACKSFYNGQGRLNGALKVSYTRDESNAYLAKAATKNICGIDMESACFFAVCREFNIPAVVILEITTNRSDEKHDTDLISQNNNVVNGNHIQNVTKLVINHILQKSS